MTLLLNESDVRALLTMPLALEAVEESLLLQGKGELSLHPRRRLRLPDNAFLHYMAAGDPVHGYMGMKLYTVARGVARFVVPLFRSTTGEMAALIEADALGPDSHGRGQRRRNESILPIQMRAARASSARATRRGRNWKRSRPCAGSKRVRAFGRDPERRAQFCREMSARIGVDVEPANSGEEAVRGADIVIYGDLCDKDRARRRWLSPGTTSTPWARTCRRSANWTMRRSAART